MLAQGGQLGSYRIVQQIGEGGMGTVWLAEHATIGHRVAIKVLLPEYSARPEIVQRFFNEARAAAAIADPGIVQIFDFGHAADGGVYIVMELLEGEPLDKRLARLGRLPVLDALRIVRQVASSVGAAHLRGIIHRDLKPENIFLQHDPEVLGGERAKVVDFGIAKLAGDGAAVKTQTSAIMGTPTYMSPEQCRGAGHVDLRSDVYSLGCVLFTLVAGRAPFEASAPGELIVMHLTHPAPRASSYAPEIPAAVDGLIARCLAKHPDERFSSGGELAAAISQVLGVSSPELALSARALPPPATSPGAAPAVTTLSSAAASVTPPGKPRRGVVIAGVAVAAVAIAVVVGIAASGPSSTAPDAPPEPAADPTPPATTAATPIAPATRATLPPPDAAPARDLAAETTARVRKILEGFVVWSRRHAGAPCPTIDELARAADDADATRDAWGYPFAVTCTEQPVDQMIGVLSAGPDREPSTADDIASWTLPDARLVLGPRWHQVVAVKPPPSRPRPSRPRPKPSKRPKPPAATGAPGDIDGDGIPDSR